MNAQAEMGNESRNAVRAFWIGLALLTLARAVFNGIVPMTGEDAYYWSCSHNLDLCYFDHPPLNAWLIRLCTAVLGISAFAVRVAPLLCHTATAVIMYHFTWRMTADRARAAWAGGLFAVAGWFAATATIAVPGSAIYLCWALTLWTMFEAVQPGRRKLWLAAGAALGLCALADFHAILLAVVMGLFLLLSPRQRGHFRSGWLYLGALITLLESLPIFIWNAREGWPTFLLQLSGRHERVLGSPNFILEMLLAPFGYVGPVMFPLVVAGTVWGFLRARRNGRDDLLLMALGCATPFIFFLALSPFIKIDPQWAAPAFVPGLMLAAMLGVELARDPGRPRWQRWSLPASLWVNAALLFLAYGAVLLILAFPNLIPPDLQLVPYRPKTRAARLDMIYGWREIGARLQAEVELLGGPERAFICGERVGYGTAALFYFYSGGEAQTFALGRTPERGHQFFIWARRARLKGMNAVIVCWKGKGADQGGLQQDFEHIEQAPDLMVTRGGRERQRYSIIRAWNLQHELVPEKK